MSSPLSITASIITYNSMSYIEDCLTSLVLAGVEERFLLVVDDGSTDGTVDFVRDRFPQATVFPLPGNFGHSRACNEAIKNSTTEWVVLIDHDTVVHPGWFVELKEAIARHPEAGIVVSRAVFESDRETIHSDGGYPHYLGSMILRNGFVKLPEADNNEVELGAAGTTSMAVNREKGIEVGLFDEDFFIYLNDFEFSMRMRLAGYQIFCAPRSIIYHKGGSQGVSFRGTGAYPSRRAYLIFRNRLFLLLKVYRIRTLLLCLPSFAVYEMILLFMAAKKGVVKEYFRAITWILGNFSLVLSKRKDVLRRIADRELLTSGELTFVPGLIQGKVAKVGKKTLELFWSFFWRAVRLVL